MPAHSSASAISIRDVDKSSQDNNHAAAAQCSIHVITSGSDDFNSTCAAVKCPGQFNQPCNAPMAFHALLASGCIIMKCPLCSLRRSTSELERMHGREPPRLLLTCVQSDLVAARAMPGAATTLAQTGVVDAIVATMQRLHNVLPRARACDSMGATTSAAYAPADYARLLKAAEACAQLPEHLRRRWDDAMCERGWQLAHRGCEGRWNGRIPIVPIPAATLRALGGGGDGESGGGASDDEQRYMRCVHNTVLGSTLFEYQKDGVMFGLRHGGRMLLADEMGLGKTVQICAFFAALHRSGLYKPSLVVCPATVMEQWRDELVKWTGGLFHVCILHASADRRGGAGAGNRQEDEDDEEEQFARGALVANPSGGVRRRANNSGRVKRLKQALRSTNTVVITTYDMVRAMRDHLIPVRWGYVVLDEGHKIRNPDADITITCKCLRTVHRIILSGAPIQNHLTELWSLFDFVFPGRLGTLPVFQAQYAIPIQIGGYTNATPLQVQTAYQCSVSLRDLVTPYLLRRMKCDVLTTTPDEGGGSGGDKQHDIDDSKDGGMDKMDKVVLPKKTEQVLFCSLTPIQLQAYRSYLASKECSDILEEDDLNIDPDRRKSRRRKLLAGIDTLRKVCNHPDLLDRVASVVSNDPDYGNVERSGKLTVLDKILQEWHSKGHRCLVFTQTQQMLDIIERHVFEKHGETFQYRRMDGSTAVDRRAGLMEEFNAPDSGIFLFLLTTRVGGLGTNLIGADRVVIFDPDWNPSTDIQARERAWRIGQTKNVTIYRLITTGTIEEKVYHRQIYKSLLTEKVLRDPKHKRLFSSRDLRDLFSLGAEYENVPIKSAATQVAESSMHAMRGGGGLETMQIFGEAMEDHRKAQALQPSDSSAAAAAAAAAAAPMLDAWGDYDYDGEYDDLLPPPDDEEEMEQDALLPKDNPQPPEPSKETAILDELLRSSIAGAVDHDAVVGAGLDCGDGNGSGGGDAGRRLGLRAEAARSARLAAQAVQKSSAVCAKSGGVHVPTWTGRAGSAGAPGSRFGAVGTGASVARVGSSAEGCAAGTTPIGIGSGGILAQIRARANASKNAGAM